MRHAHVAMPPPIIRQHPAVGAAVHVPEDGGVVCGRRRRGRAGASAEGAVWGRRCGCAADKPPQPHTAHPHITHTAHQCPPGWQMTCLNRVLAGMRKAAVASMWHRKPGLCVTCFTGSEAREAIWRAAGQRAAAARRLLMTAPPLCAHLDSHILVPVDLRVHLCRVSRHHVVMSGRHREAAQRRGRCRRLDARCARPAAGRRLAAAAAAHPACSGFALAGACSAGA